jgi:response regulator of citrate/malate metabolism
MTQTTTFENTVTHPLRVFLVEDSLDVRELMIENLTMIPGVVVAGVSESEGDALNQLNALPCDVLIVDIQLKKGNGINLLRQISEKAIMRLKYFAASAASMASTISSTRLLNSRSYSNWSKA